MLLLYNHLFPAMWMAWALYWWALSRHVKPNARRESLVSRLLHIAPLVVAVLLLWAPSVPFAPARFSTTSGWPSDSWIRAAMGRMI